MILSFSFSVLSTFRCFSFKRDISPVDSRRISSILSRRCAFVRFISLMLLSNFALSLLSSINSFSRASPSSIVFKLSWLSLFLLKTSRIVLNSLFSFSNACILLLYSSTSPPNRLFSKTMLLISNVGGITLAFAQSLRFFCKISLSRLNERIVSSNLFMLSDISRYLSSR